VPHSSMKLSELGSFIRDQRNAARLSLRKLSDLAGISNPYLSQIERGLRKPSAEILQAIAKALQISAETLYERAGLLDTQEGHDLISEILKDDALSERQKQALIATYRSFRESDVEPYEEAATLVDAIGRTADGRESRAAGATASKSTRKKA
jgi:transcriptional regulator with XRE-family HTH domain